MQKEKGEGEMQNAKWKSEMRKRGKQKAKARRIKTPAFLFRIAGEKYGKSAKAV
jgi:hypothetical protein